MRDRRCALHPGRPASRPCGAHARPVHAAGQAIASGLPDGCRRLATALLAASMVLVLPACGGGGGQSDTGVPDVGAAVDGDPAVGDTQTSPYELVQDQQGSGYYAVANNSALLVGDSVGDGRIANAALGGRLLPGEIGGDPAGRRGLVLRSMLLLEQESVATLVGVIENHSSDILCEVGLEAVSLLDRNGAPLTTAVTADLRVRGAIGVATDELAGAASDGCLGPGTLAYAIAPVEAPAAEVAGFAAQSLGSLARVPGPADPATRSYRLADNEVTPVLYAVNSLGNIELTLVNNEAGDVQLERLTILFLGSDGLPVGVRELPTSATIQRGYQALMTVADTDAGFAGTSSMLRIIVDYQPRRL